MATVSTTLPADYPLLWYRIGAVLGQGGFGITYAANDANLVKAVAIKEFFPKQHAVRNPDGTVRPQQGRDDQIFEWGLRRFVDEARTLAQFQHPNICRVLSVFEENGSAYMVMELEHGFNLAEAVKRRLIQDEPALLRVLLPLLDGLEAVHASGFIHRDIKPDNILLRDDMSAVLLDFGSARQALGGESQQLTAVVSHGYAPFEQYNVSGRDAKQGPWTDIYSLGATLYQIVTDSPPLDALTRGSSLLEQKPDPFPSLAGKPHDRYSECLLSAIDAALHFRPDERPQSIAEWRSLFPRGAGVSSDSGSGNHSSPREPAPADANADKDAPPSVDGAQVSASIRDSNAPQTDFAALRVLIVDDEAYVRNMHKRTLANLGVSAVTMADSGKAALEQVIAEERAFDIILSDLQMPDMDGIQLLRHLGELKVTSGIILVSGVEKTVLETAKSLAGVHDLYILGAVTKPFKPAQMEALIRAYDPQRTTLSEGSLESLSEEELRAGLEQGAVTTYYQPKIAIASRKMIGAEALARWNHRDGHVLGPGAFIPLAERHRLITPLTDQVFAQAMDQLGEWRSWGLDLGVSVNVSVDSLADVGFPDHLRGLAEERGADPKAITVEVTESRMVEDFKATLEILSRLRLMGMKLSIDDFGTGYASLEQLKQAPFGELKIDRAFVQGAADDPTSRAILESSVSLAKRLDLFIVAEGVETQADWDLVEALGCDAVQGYFVSKPVTGARLPEAADAWGAVV